MYFVNYQKGKIIITATFHELSLCVNLQPFIIVQNKEKPNPHKMMHFYTFIGITRIKQQAFFVFASQVNLKCTIEGSSIFEINQVQLLPICEWEDKEKINASYDTQIKHVSKLFQNGQYYYADNYNLSFPYLLNRIKKPTFQQRQYYEQFIWNKALIEAKTPQVLSKWCRPIIQGYIQNFAIQIPGNVKVIYYLISRRSSLKAGTRFYARGIDDNGNVANFTESEQIVLLKDYAITHLQIRGSVPVFFEQIGVNGLMDQLVIPRSAALTEKPFKTHFQNLKNIYKRVLCLNLLSVKRLRELKLTQFFQKMISDANLDYVRYQFFDFHQQCKGEKFQNCEYLIQKVLQVIQSFNFNCFDKKNHILMGQQTGIVRTNCLDCLDRTNYVQSRVAFAMLRQILENMSLPEQRDKYEQEKIFDYLQGQKEQINLMNSFNVLWADNGDSISNHYTGIGSTHTDITKGGGKRTLVGMVNHKIKSLMRFYTQFTDIKKHQAINTLVLTKKSTIRRSMAQFQQHHDSLVFSWSITPQVPTEFFPQDMINSAKPSFIIFSLYSEVPAEWHQAISSLFSKRATLQIEWRQFVTSHLQRLGYVQVSCLQVSRNTLLVYSLKSLVKQISNIKTEKKPPSMRSSSYLLVKFSFQHSSFVFCGVNCQKIGDFYPILDQIHQQAFQSYKLGQFRSSSVLEQNYRTILGNIGSKSSLSNSEVEKVKNEISQIQNKEGDLKQKYILISKALDHDEFSKKNENSESVFSKNYIEGPISFFPTNNRILFWNRQTLIVKVIAYEMKNGCVFGHYNYEIKKKM